MKQTRDSRQVVGRGVTLIEMLIVIAMMAVLLSSVLVAYLMVIRIERGVTSQQLAMHSLQLLNRAWRQDIHGAAEVSLSEPASSTTLQTLVVKYEGKGKEGGRRVYQIIANADGTKAVVRQVFGPSGQELTSSTLVEKLNQARFEQGSKPGIFLLGLEQGSGFDAYRKTTQLTLLAAQQTDAITLPRGEQKP